MYSRVLAHDEAVGGTEGPVSREQHGATAVSEAPEQRVSLERQQWR